MSKAGEVILSVKGRDYFDLMWYLEKGIKPNLDCLEVKNMEELKVKLLSQVDKIDEKSLILDLENFVADKDFVMKLGKGIKSILQESIKRNL